VHPAVAATEVFHALAQTLQVDPAALRVPCEQRWPLGQSLAFIAGTSAMLWLAVVGVYDLLLG
jgi:hypothetical protein